MPKELDAKLQSLRPAPLFVTSERDSFLHRRDQADTPMSRQFADFSESQIDADATYR